MRKLNHVMAILMIVDVSATRILKLNVVASKFFPRSSKWESRYVAAMKLGKVMI